MSHVASVKAFVQDLDALASVADRLGLELVKHATTYAWYGAWVNDFRGANAAVDNGHDPANFGKCVHKLRRKDHAAGDYEIGLVPRLDGKPGYEMVYDNWGGGGRRIEQCAGKGLGALKQAMAQEVSLRIMRRQGYRVTSTTAADGRIVMTCTK